MNETTHTADTRILQIIVMIAAFTMLAAMLHYSKTTTVSVPLVKEWVADSTWTEGWK